MLSLTLEGSAFKSRQCVRGALADQQATWILSTPAPHTDEACSSKGSTNVQVRPIIQGKNTIYSPVEQLQKHLAVML